MLGTYDFNGAYDWTFSWLIQRGGQAALRDYWESAISVDSQRHAREAFARGIDGMQDYWGHTLAEEGAGYTSNVQVDASGEHRVFRMDMYDCPSKGFLLRNKIDFSPDYCDHCIAWIGPAMADAGFTIDHEHDHAAHCWWEFREMDDSSAPSHGTVFVDVNDVRLRHDWQADNVDTFRRANHAEGKLRRKPSDT